MAEKIAIPEAPGGLPDDVVARWKERYEEIYREAEIDWPHDTDRHKSMAIHAANRTLRTPEITSYEHAQSLAAWYFLLREPSEDGKTLRIVTREAKKCSFPIPQGDAAVKQSGSVSCCIHRIAHQVAESAGNSSAPWRTH